jgi:hypothetical protein
MLIEEAVPSPELRSFVDAAVRQLREDVARLGRAMEVLSRSDGAPSSALFAAIATAYRHALANARKIEALDLDYEHKSAALAVFTMQATGLEAYHRSFRASTGAGQRRLDARASMYFKASSTAFLRLDQLLGCPYGCTES